MRARNRISFKCFECGIQSESKVSVYKKSPRHFCSAKCRNVCCGREKQLHKYPKIIGKCLYCQKDIVATYAGLDKKNRKYCSASCRTSANNKLIVVSSESRAKHSNLMKNRWLDDSYRAVFQTPEYRKRQSERNKGEKSHFWRGGLTEENRKQRNSVETKLWREAVFQRDNYTCVFCGVRSGTGRLVILNADHILPWSSYEALRFDISNGRTLCLECHKKTDTFGNRFRISSLRGR